MSLENETAGGSTALSWSSSICSIIGTVSVILLQTLRFDDHHLLFWWLTTAMIGIAAISACFTPPSLPLRAVFAIVFVAQLPAFDRAWAGLPESNSEWTLRLGEPDEKEKQIDDLERENAMLKRQRVESVRFWQAIAHLTGMGFAMLACTAAGQRRVRLVYEDN